MKAINNTAYAAAMSSNENLMYEGRFTRSTKELVASHTVLTANDGTCAAYDIVDPGMMAGRCTCRRCR